MHGIKAFKLRVDGDRLTENGASLSMIMKAVDDLCSVYIIGIACITR